MVSTREQYEVYPYPARDPADEAKRLIVGSPSQPIEIDHFLFQGRRDWTKPMRVLIAGGGTGDALIQLAQMMTSAGAPYRITYLDLSTASREIAEARAAKRGLANIAFETGSLLEAGAYGPFDYIDCCGVLHHLPDPAEGFAALRRALVPGGGMGFMVYAPYGRSGIYPLQEAFGALFDGLDAKTRLEKAQSIVASLPAGHPFAANPNLMDHKVSDAGFYDLLLHGQDTPFDVPRLLQTCADSGWRLQSFCTPALYDLGRIADRPEGMDDTTAMAVAEKLRGTIRKHVGYLVPSDEDRPLPKGTRTSLVPRVQIKDMRALAERVAAGKPLPVTVQDLKTQITLNPATAPVLAGIDNRRSLSQIARALRLDPLRFGPLWAEIERAFVAHGLLHYSGFGR